MIPHSRPWITDADRAAVDAALRDGRLASGERALAFEEAFAAAFALAGATAVESGRAALRLALAALGVGTGDEVVLPTYVCGACADAIRALGARPVLCDVGPAWVATPDEVRRRLTGRTKAIVVVHIFGILADTTAFAELGVPVVENCAQALGAPDGGLPAGARGAAAVYSFHATKPLTTGEGGMAASADPKLASRIRALRSADLLARPMTDLQASLGLSQLARRKAGVRRRREIADRYFAELPAPLTARLAAVRAQSLFFRFPLLAPWPFEPGRAALERRGVCVRRGVDALLHRTAGLPDADFPGAAGLFASTTSLPIYPALSDEEQGAVIAALQRLAAGGA